MNFTNIIFQDPVWRQTGRELQVLADAFGRSPGRLLVRQRAEQVDVRTLDMDKFWSLLKALFEVNIPVNTHFQQELLGPKIRQSSI